ncbi:hypothetical protein LC653_43870 [Nostoc sp. CHAB 5784]|nr:hypothetical protein [Nostoc mirabile CHAB5784]
MSVRFLENKGSGNILEISRARLLELTPNVYPLTWKRFFRVMVIVQLSWVQVLPNVKFFLVLRELT